MVEGEDELEEIRRRKIMQLQMAAQQEAERKAKEAQLQELKQSVLRQILTSDARERLARVRLAKPELAEMIENQLIMLAQSGRLRTQVTDEVLKELLSKVQSERKETRIIRK
ncbi:MAG: DNA-binding protein [Thermoplasmata archaeon]